MKLLETTRNVQRSMNRINKWISGLTNVFSVTESHRCRATRYSCYGRSSRDGDREMSYRWDTPDVGDRSNYPRTAGSTR